MTLANNHHKSCGEYFSWGNKGNYEMKGKSSVGCYATKPGVKSALNSAYIEQMMNAELQSSITNMEKILHILPSVVAPVIRVVYQLQSMMTDINITKPYGSNVGVW